MMFAYICLSDVEAVVEEMRQDAVSCRCHVSSKEVESLALVLSQFSRSMATLKSMLQFDNYYMTTITVEYDTNILTCG